MSKENSKTKTNAMRELEAAHIAYTPLYYDPALVEVEGNSRAGLDIAHATGMPEEITFKTLVGRGDKTGPLVFCVPVALNLDLKQAAQVSGNKRVELLPVKELLPLTGYIRGGCSPIGMKKRFPTYLHASAKQFEEITVSAGMKGCQLRLSTEALVRLVGAVYF